MTNTPIYQPQQAATQFPGMPNYGQPTYGQPAYGQPIYQPPVAAAPPYIPPPAPAAGNGWQANPVLAAQALATNQPKARGYSPDPPAPSPPSIPLSLRLPAPEDLGVGRAAPPTTPNTAAVDWNHAHARMRELGVVRFSFTRVAGGLRVSMEMPNGRVVDGLGESESAALAMAFEWATK